VVLLSGVSSTGQPGRRWYHGTASTIRAAGPAGPGMLTCP
jgi:hypothetical protein